MKKTILITGAAKRIGASLVKKFHQKGWNIILHYNTSAQEAEELKNSLTNDDNKIVAIRADLQKEADIINLFKEAQTHFEEIDVLINNAAVFPPKKELKDTSVDFWDNVFDINLRAQFITTREFVKHSSKNAKVINFASLGGLEIWEKRISYNVSKSAVIQLTKALARELAPNIAVNCICPGLVKIDENYFSIPEENIPMKRYATIDDVFELAYFLSTCTNYITGQIISVDGGMSLKKNI
ncbi:MAG: SDR family oxidoreductase [Ignavibacteria bacterium]|nr:SDR family oxidoreductase [Ignavibacteria bacterium]